MSRCFTGWQAEKGHLWPSRQHCAGAEGENERLEVSCPRIRKFSEGSEEFLEGF